MQPTASLPPQAALHRFHVVLVEPGDPINIGAVARAMSNLGFAHLHLVAPPRYDAQRAEQSACWGTDVLNQAHWHDDLPTALAPMQAAVGFTARHGRNRPEHLLLHEWRDLMAGEAFPGDVALLFGPEDHGLRQEHLALCRWLVRIPSTAANPSFNLAQAALLVLYELTRTHWDAIPQADRRLPGQADFQQLDRLVTEVLTRSGFFYEGTPAPVPDVVRHLMRRTDPDEREMRLLLGLFGKLNRVLRGRVPVRRGPDDPPDEEQR